MSQTSPKLPQINVSNEQKIVDIDPNLLIHMMQTLISKENVKANEVSIFLIDDQKITELHRKYFNDETPTDCISFPIDNPDTDEGYLGDIFVSTETAQRYAEENHLNVIDEIKLYIIHGFLHLLGYDDLNDQDRKSMREKEQECLSYLN